ncbi:transposase [Patescibacteria group bacterium]
MSNFKIYDDGSDYFLTIVVKKKAFVLLRWGIADAIVKSLRYCQRNKGIIIYAFVIMPDHLHLLVGLKDNGNVSGFLRDFKRHTTKMIKGLLPATELAQFQINQVTDRYQVWEHQTWVVYVDSEKVFEQKEDYIHWNPVVAGYVGNPARWRFSSYRMEKEI